MFNYLLNLGIKKVNVVYAQDNDQMYIVIKSEQTSPERARAIISGVNMMVSMAKLTVKDEDEKLLLNSAKITNQDKLCILEFALAKSVAQEIIKREFDKETSRRKVKKQNS